MLFFRGDVFKVHFFDAAGGELFGEEVAEVGFGCVDWGVDDEEGARGVGVWDARFVRA